MYDFLLSTMTKILTPLDPELCLIGHYVKMEPLNKYQSIFFGIALAVARKCIALTWKSDYPAFIQMVHRNEQFCAVREK